MGSIISLASQAGRDEEIWDDLDKTNFWKSFG